MWLIAGKKIGELNREVLECFHLRHLQWILSIERASVISVALLFLLNWLGQNVSSQAFCVPTSLQLVEKSRVSFSPSIPNVDVGAWETGLGNCWGWCSGVYLQVWVWHGCPLAQESLARLACFQSRSFTGVKFMHCKYAHMWGWKYGMNCLGISSRESFHCQSEALVTRFPSRPSEDGEFGFL